MKKRVNPKSLENLKMWKKGESGNPIGSRAHNPATRALKKITLESYREMIELVLTGNLSQLKEIAENPKTPALQVGIATAFMKAIKEGNHEIIERIAERLVGKIPDELNIKSQSLNANLNAEVPLEKVKAALQKLQGDV